MFMQDSSVLFCFSWRGSSLLTLVGYPKRTLLARSSQWVPKDLVTLSRRSLLNFVH